MNVIGHGTQHRSKMEAGELYTGQYLDKYLYPYISVSYERNSETQAQIKGIDVYLSGSTTAITIDEKCTCLWLGRNLQKISFELSTLCKDENGDIYTAKGWLLADTINTHYAMIWVDDATTKNGSQLIGSGITDCTVAIIAKNSLLEALSDMGWNKDALSKKDRLIRDAYKIYGNEYSDHIRLGNIRNDGIHFVLYTNQEELGVNIQLPRSKCISISDYACRIKNNSIERLK